MAAVIGLFKSTDFGPERTAQVTQIADTTSTNLSLNDELIGTVWSLHNKTKLASFNAESRIIFLRDGRFLITDNRINNNNSDFENPKPHSTHWKVSGSKIDFDIDQHIYWEGDLSGKGTMSGKGWSDFNFKWDWDGKLSEN